MPFTTHWPTGTWLSWSVPAGDGGGHGQQHWHWNLAWKAAGTEWKDRSTKFFSREAPGRLRVLALCAMRSFQGCAVIQCWACLVSEAGKKLKSFPPFPAELICIWSTSFTNMLLKYLKGWRLTWTEGAIFLVIWGWQTCFYKWINSVSKAERQIGSLEFHTTRNALESVPTSPLSNIAVGLSQQLLIKVLIFRWRYSILLRQWHHVSSRAKGTSAPLQTCLSWAHWKAQPDAECWWTVLHLQEGRTWMQAKVY